jgi:hypothetical protein
MICGEALWRDGNPSYPLPLAWQHENPNVRALNVRPAGPFSPKAGPPPPIPKLVAIVTTNGAVIIETQFHTAPANRTIDCCGLLSEQETLFARSGEQ